MQSETQNLFKMAFRCVPFREFDFGISRLMFHGWCVGAGEGGRKEGLLVVKREWGMCLGADPENFYPLLSNLVNSEHRNYFRNVYCVMTIHIGDQDTRANHKITNKSRGEGDLHVKVMGGDRCTFYGLKFMVWYPLGC